jgi:tetratricopeptide (TPR) repeat protein
MRKAVVLLRMGELLMDVDREQARQLFEESLVLFRALGLRWQECLVLRDLGWRAWHVGELTKAQQYYEESLAIAQALGDVRLQGMDTLGLSAVAWSRGQLAQAERLSEQSLALRRELGDPLEVSGGLYSLGVKQISLGRLTQAVAKLEEARAVYRDRLGISNEWVFSMLGWAKMFLGHYAQAHRHAQAALEIDQETQNQRSLAWAHYVLAGISLGQGRLDQAEAHLQASLRASRPIQQRMTEALALICSGYTRCLSGYLAQARRDLAEGLQIGREAGIGSALVHGVAGIALLEARRADILSADESRRAVELYALAAQDPLVANARWFEDVVGRHVSAAAAAATDLSPDAIAEAQARGRALDLDATVAAWLAETEREFGKEP